MIIYQFFFVSFALLARMSSSSNWSSFSLEPPCLVGLLLFLSLLTSLPAAGALGLARYPLKGQYINCLNLLHNEHTSQKEVLPLRPLPNLGFRWVHSQKLRQRMRTTEGYYEPNPRTFVFEIFSNTFLLFLGCLRGFGDSRCHLNFSG